MEAFILKPVTEREVFIELQGEENFSKQKYGWLDGGNFRFFKRDFNFVARQRGSGEKK